MIPSSRLPMKGLTLVVILIALSLYQSMNSGQVMIQHPSLDGHAKVLESTVDVERKDYIMDRTGWDASPIVVEQYNLVFFTVAKVACTVWKQLFRRMMGFDGNWFRSDSRLPHDPRINGLKYLYHYNTTMATHIMNSPKWTKVIMIRDPKERFLSAYLDKALRDGGNYMEKCCRRVQQEPNKYHEYIDWLNKTYSDATINLKSTCRKSVQSSLLDFYYVTTYVCPENHHWLPQRQRLDEKYWKYFVNQQQQRQQNVLVIANLDDKQEFSKHLLQQIGAWETYGKSGWGPHQNESIFFSPTKAIGNANTKMQRYYTTRELEQLIETKYQQDYEFSLFQFDNKSIVSNET